MRRHARLLGLGFTLCAGAANAQVDVRAWPRGDLDGAVAARARAGGQLALTPDDATLAVADEDAGELVLIDADALAVRSRVWVGARPGAVLSLPDGEIAVACRDDGWVALVDPTLERVTRRIATDREPRALASDGRRLFVASFADATVAAYDLATGERLWSRAVAASPVALALNAAHEHLWVSHLTRGVIESLAPEDGSEGADPMHHVGFVGGGALALAPLPSGDVVAPHFVRNHGLWGKEMFPESGAYGGEPESPLNARLEVLSRSRRDDLSVRRTKGPRRPARVIVPTGERSPLDLPATLAPARGAEVRYYVPRSPVTDPDVPASMTAAAWHPSGRLFIVDTALGKLWVVEGLRREARGYALRGDVAAFELGVTPTDITFDRTGERAFVAFAHARGVAVARVADATCVGCTRTVGQLDPRVWRSLQYGEPPVPEVAVARRLFHAVDARVSGRDLACASCHPDGLTDGRTWVQSFGPRQTPVLAGRLAGTSPFGWTGTIERLDDHIAHTIRHRILGRGLPADDLAALSRFVAALPAPAVRRHEPGLVERGRAVFSRADVGCDTCHAPHTRYTDGGRYDIGTTSRDETQRARFGRSSRLSDAADAPLPVPIAYDVPSLVGLAHSAPYFHDGSAATLRDVVTTKNPHDRMGATSHLTPSELDALVAFLETL